MKYYLSILPTSYLHKNRITRKPDGGNNCLVCCYICFWMQPWNITPCQNNWIEPCISRIPLWLGGPYGCQTC